MILSLKQKEGSGKYKQADRCIKALFANNYYCLVAWCNLTLLIASYLNCKFSFQSIKTSKRLLYQAYGASTVYWRQLALS
jgi:hypothetical protein